MQIRQYFELFKQLESLEKEYKLNLSEQSILTIVQEYGKDLRTNQIGEQKKAVPQIELATEKQKEMLKRLKVKYPENLTKKEASKIIETTLKS